MRDFTELSSGPFLLKAWNKLLEIPGGKVLFSWLVGQIAPYSGSIRPAVQALAPGHCKIYLRERRGLRNHLNSVHAIATANLAELASGMAVVCSIPKESRGILVGFRIEYKKKGRGVLTAESRFDSGPVSSDGEHEVAVSVHDAQGDLVAEAHARWLVSPRRKETA